MHGPAITLMKIPAVLPLATGRHDGNAPHPAAPGDWRVQDVDTVFSASDTQPNGLGSRRRTTPKDPPPSSAVMIINAAIGFIQEEKAEQVLSHHATVQCDEQSMRINAEERLPGDVAFLQPGDNISPTSGCSR